LFRTAAARAASASRREWPATSPLKRRYRLRRKPDFQAALRGKRIYSGRGLVALAFPSETAHTRIGVTVSRQLKTSVDRNRARRRLRELARLTLLQADSGSQRRGIGYDVILIARPAALTLRFVDLKEEAEQAALRLTRLDA
jgi:ribonuclease P protein component